MLIAQLSNDFSVHTEHKWDDVALQSVIGSSVPVQYLHSGRILARWKMRGGVYLFIYFSQMWVEDRTEARSCKQKKQNKKPSSFSLSADRAELFQHRGRVGPRCIFHGAQLLGLTSASP